MPADSSRTSPKTVPGSEPHESFLSKKTALWLGAILGLALLLRVIYNSPSVVSFWVDEAVYSVRAISIINHHGIYDPAFLYDHPPLFMYVQSLAFTLFGSQWYVARGLGIMLGLITLLLFFQIGRTWKGERMGLVLAALFAVQPIVVEINRQALIENLLMLWLAASFLALLKYDRSAKPHFFMLAMVLFALAMITKFTAAIFFLPLLTYVIVRRVYRTKVFLASAIVFGLLVLPVLYLNIQHGALQFHFGKVTGDDVYIYIGDYSIPLGHFAAIVMTIMWLNVGLAPMIWKAAVQGKRKARGLKPALLQIVRYLTGNPAIAFVLAWGVGALAFFSLFNVIGRQYIYSIMIPLLLLVGVVIYKHPAWIAVIIVLFMILSGARIATYSLKASNDTVTYLQQNIGSGDRLIIPENCDRSVFEYYFPHNKILDLTSESLERSNATFVVLKTSSYDRLKSNETLMEALRSNYSEAFRTDYGPTEINFIVFARAVR